MRSPALHLTTDPIDTAAVAAQLVEPAQPGADGAVVTFVGLVRQENLGREVVRLEYEAYEPLALKALAVIAAEAAEAWPGVRLAVTHRLGVLVPGEASIAIVAASPHRAAGFAACRYVIERVKQIVPIWKREHYVDGDSWLEGATADPDDRAARDEARARACA